MAEDKRGDVPSAPTSEGVLVKPLEWRFFDTSHEYGKGCWDANAPWTTMSIYDCGDRFGLDARYYARSASRSFGTLDEAKAAVHDFYEALIRSALLPAPTRDDVLEEAVRAIEEYERQPFPGFEAGINLIKKDLINRVKKLKGAKP